MGDSAARALLDSRPSACATWCGGHRGILGVRAAVGGNGIREVPDDHDGKIVLETSSRDVPADFGDDFIGRTFDRAQAHLLVQRLDREEVTSGVPGLTEPIGVHQQAVPW